MNPNESIQTVNDIVHVCLKNQNTWKNIEQRMEDDLKKFRRKAMKARKKYEQQHPAVAARESATKEKVSMLPTPAGITKTTSPKAATTSTVPPAGLLTGGLLTGGLLTGLFTRRSNRLLPMATKNKVDMKKEEQAPASNKRKEQPKPGKAATEEDAKQPPKKVPKVDPEWLPPQRNGTKYVAPGKKWAASRNHKLTLLNILQRYAIEELKSAPRRLNFCCVVELVIGDSGTARSFYSRVFIYFVGLVLNLKR